MAMAGKTDMKCFYCGIELYSIEKNENGMGRVRKDSITMDHLLPASRGGAGMHNNKVACCARCNFDKGSLTLEEYRVVIAYRRKLLPSGDYLPRFPGES